MTTIFSGPIGTSGTFSGSNYNVLKRTGNKGMSMQMVFTYGSGGTTVDAKVQTSLDGGTTWVDIWHASQFTTSNATRLASVQQVVSVSDTSNAALGAATIRDGFLGPLLKVTYTGVGTYTSTTLSCDVYGDQLQVSPTSFE
jgi:hypothetical protein